MAAGTLLLALLPGCGDHAPTAKERYERGVAAVFRRAEIEGRRFDTYLRPAVKGGARGAGLAYERIRDFILRMSARLARLHPPAEVRAAHRTMIEAFRELALGPMRRQFAILATRGERAAMYAITHPEPEVLRIAARARQARAIFRAHGYNLAPSGGPLP